MKFVVFSRICVAFSIFSGALMQAQSHLLRGLDDQICWKDEVFRFAVLNLKGC